MKKEKQIMGKKSREAGARFERKVRADLESKGWIHSQEENVHFGETKWIVDRWSNQVDLETDKLVQAKSFMGRTRTNGFPDFIAFRLSIIKSNYEVIGVEAKSKGYLDKIEKEKCEWLLKNKIFGKIFVAEKFGSEINYKEIVSLTSC